MWLQSRQITKTADQWDNKSLSYLLYSRTNIYLVCNLVLSAIKQATCFARFTASDLNVNGHSAIWQIPSSCWHLFYFLYRTTVKFPGFWVGQISGASQRKARKAVRELMELLTHSHSVSHGCLIWTLLQITSLEQLQTVYLQYEVKWQPFPPGLETHKDHCCWGSQSPCQYFSVEMIYMGPQDGREKEDSPLPLPPGHPPVDAAHDTIYLLCCKHAFLACVKLFIH